MGAHGREDMGFGGFSWKRAAGITRVKQKIARATGVPLTREGRRRKVDRATGCGRFVGLALLFAAALAFLGHALIDL